MTISPGIWNNFVIYQGGTFSYVIVWKDENGALVNLTGYTAEMKARYNLSDPTPFLDLTTSNGGITLGGSAGTVTLTMSSTATAALAPGTGVYDLRLLSGSDAEFLLQGDLTVQQMVTR